MAISLYFATVRIRHILTNISDLHFLDLVRVTCNRDYMNPSLYMEKHVMINLLFRLALLKLHTLLKNSLYMFLFFFFQSYNVHEIIIENTLYIVLKHIFATKKNNNNNKKKEHW